MLLFCGAGAGWSQNSTLAFGELMPAGTSGVRYRQELNTYVWQLGLMQRYRLGGRWQLSFQEQFRSSMLRLGGSDDKWKDEQDFAALLNYRLAPTLKLFSQLSSLAFIDKQSGFNNDVRGYSGGLGLQFTPARYASLRGSAGPRWEMRLGQNDRGYFYAADASLEAIDWGGYLNSASATLIRDEYQHRTNHDAQVSYRASKTFSAGTSDSIRVYLNDRRRDNYVSEAGDVESQREGNKGLENDLVYGISHSAQLRLRSLYTLRDVELVSYASGEAERSRKRNDEINDHTLTLDFHPDRWRGRVLLSYLGLTQKYDIARGDSHLPFSQRIAFLTPDNKSSRLLLSSEAAAMLGHSDSLSLYGSISRFQYDTPDTSNFDDRDELRINGKVTWSHLFTPSLYGQLQASVSLYHMVYIYGERSADNNWNRIFRLRPLLSYTPSKNLAWHQAFEVLANYVQYDFETQLMQTKSFVFRKFSYDDSLRWQMTLRSKVLLDYRLLLEENGELYWQEWKEKMLTTRTSHWLQARFSYAAVRGLGISPGYTLYLRDEWRHLTSPAGAAKKEKYSTFSSHGPVIGITYTPRPRVRVIFDAVRRRVLPYQQKRYYINTVDIHLEWHL